MHLFVLLSTQHNNTLELDKGSIPFYLNRYRSQLMWIYHHLQLIAQKPSADGHKEDMQDVLLQSRLAYFPPHGKEDALQHRVHDILNRKKNLGLLTLGPSFCLWNYFSRFCYFFRSQTSNFKYPKIRARLLRDYFLILILVVPIHNNNCHTPVLQT